MIRYADSLDGITAELLAGFFAEWPHPPSPETHLRLLQGSDAVELAIDTGTGKVVGFATALTDGILTACIPYLEVLPAHRSRGIGTQLVRRLLHRFQHLYCVDLMCDSDVQPFYERLGMRRATGMIIRRPDRQSGDW